jgi:hypothetical protein
VFFIRTRPTNCGKIDHWFWQRDGESNAVFSLRWWTDMDIEHLNSAYVAIRNFEIASKRPDGDD